MQHLRVDPREQVVLLISTLLDELSEEFVSLKVCSKLVVYLKNQIPRVESPKLAPCGHSQSLYQSVVAHQIFTSKKQIKSEHHI